MKRLENKIATTLIHYLNIYLNLYKLKYISASGTLCKVLLVTFDSGYVRTGKV